MRRFIASTLLIAFSFLIICTAVSAAGAGSADDPLITLSYLEDEYTDYAFSAADELIGRSLLPVYRDKLYALNQHFGLVRLELMQRQTGLLSTSSVLPLKSGDGLTAHSGSTLCLNAGSAIVTGAGLVDVSAGAELPAGSALTVGSTYMATTGSAYISISSPTALLGYSGEYELSVSSAPDYNSIANGLNKMGLFRGDSTGYALERTATRTEGLVMFIRLLGEEQQALVCKSSHPFTDVDSWAVPYVAYAYEKGYTNGVSATLFGSDDVLTSQHYVTFLLRALGFSEGKDFTWNSCISDSVKLGVLTSAETAALASQPFYRSLVAYCSYYALFAGDSDGVPLMCRLTGSGAVAQESMAKGLACLVGQRIS